jgi:hypothetical protein
MAERVEASDNRFRHRIAACVRTQAESGGDSLAAMDGRFHVLRCRDACKCTAELPYSLDAVIFELLHNEDSGLISRNEPGEATDKSNVVPFGRARDAPIEENVGLFEQHPSEARRRGMNGEHETLNVGAAHDRLVQTAGNASDKGELLAGLWIFEPRQALMQFEGADGEVFLDAVVQRRE